MFALKFWNMVLVLVNVLKYIIKKFLKIGQFLTSAKDFDANKIPTQKSGPGWVGPLKNHGFAKGSMNSLELG